MSAVLGLPVGTFVLLRDDEVVAVLTPDGADRWGGGYVRDVPEHPLVVLERIGRAHLRGVAPQEDAAVMKLPDDGGAVSHAGTRGRQLGLRRARPLRARGRGRS